VHAINPDGSAKWEYGADSALISSPAIGSDGTIYVGSNSGTLYAINPDGSPRWQYSAGAEILFSPVIGSDGTIYVGAYDNYLHAIHGSGTLATTDWPMFHHDEEHTGRFGN